MVAILSLTQSVGWSIGIYRIYGNVPEVTRTSYTSMIIMVIIHIGQHSKQDIVAFIYTEYNRSKV